MEEEVQNCDNPNDPAVQKYVQHIADLIENGAAERIERQVHERHPEGPTDLWKDAIKCTYSKILNATSCLTVRTQYLSCLPAHQSPNQRMRNRTMVILASGT